MLDRYNAVRAESAISRADHFIPDGGQWAGAEPGVAALGRAIGEWCTKAHSNLLALLHHCSAHLPLHAALSVAADHRAHRACTAGGRHDQAVASTCHGVRSRVAGAWTSYCRQALAQPLSSLHATYLLACRCTRCRATARASNSGGGLQRVT